MAKNIFKYFILSVVCCFASYFVWIVLGTHVYTTILQILVAIVLYGILLFVVKDKQVLQILNSKSVLK